MTSSESLRVRDFLYLDFEKAASIWSQFEEGLPERTSITQDVGKTRAAGTKFGVGLAAADLGVDYIDKRSTLQSKTLHHDVLNRVEQRLADAGLVTDLSASVPSTESSPEMIRAALGNRPYLRVEGASVLEDYRRILTISEKFNDLAAFVARSEQESVKKSPEFQQLETLLAAARQTAEKQPDRNQKAVQREKAKAAQRQLEELAKPKLVKVEQWILDGIRLWINTFMPTRINFRIFPFPNAPSFQVLCNLKEKCFVDSDLEHLLYGYGNRPNVPLTVFGLVTSIPDAGESQFNPMKEFNADAPLPERVAFEKAFRAMFGAMEGMESFVRYSRYPNVTVHPISVYRSFSERRPGCPSR